MIVLVKWKNHDRVYTMGIGPFLKHLGVNVDDAKLKTTIKHLLEQQELKDDSES
jgi:hypothetical protein